MQLKKIELAIDENDLLKWGAGVKDVVFKMLSETANMLEAHPEINTGKKATVTFVDLSGFFKKNEMGVVVEFEDE